MKTLVRENRIYFIGLGLFLLLAGIVLMFIEQGDAVFFFNERRATWSDYLFKYGTKLGEEIAYLGIGIVLLFFDYRKVLLLPILGITITFVSYFTKSLFAQDRPATYFKKLDKLADLNLLAGIDMHTGATSFPSGHTMSAFALYTLLALFLPKKWWIQLGILSLAILVGLSRIYLVQHFLRDVFAGAIMGIGFGVLFYYLYLWIIKKTDRNRKVNIA